MSFFDFTGRGQLADQLRKGGRLVVGGGSFCDRLEDDRPFGEAFAEKHGIQAPPSYRFSTITQAISFLRKDPKQKVGDGGWAWKPNKPLGCDATWVDKSTEGMIGWLLLCALPQFGDNNTCLLQERIPGVALSTARWWNGRTWVGPYEATLEEKEAHGRRRWPLDGLLAQSHLVLRRHATNRSRAKVRRVGRIV